MFLTVVNEVDSSTLNSLNRSHPKQQSAVLRDELNLFKYYFEAPSV